jgi:hypothetical protein
MNNVKGLSVVDLVTIRTGSASIALAGVDIKEYEGTAKIIVQTQGDAAVLAALQDSDVQAYDDSDWADVDATTYDGDIDSASATTTVWTVPIQDLKRYIRVTFANASTVAVVMVAKRKYPA